MTALVSGTFIRPAPANTDPRLIECAVPMTNCDEPEFHYQFGIGLFIEASRPRPPG
jgi:hypothetical protein